MYFTPQHGNFTMNDSKKGINFLAIHLDGSYDMNTWTCGCALMCDWEKALEVPWVNNIWANVSLSMEQMVIS
jgi:hypothetical protein